MNDKAYILEFLSELREHNSKEWMDKNKERYQTAKEIWLKEIELILGRLTKHDPTYLSVEPKSTLSRINNNRRFHPDKPIYKDFFTCEPSGKQSAGALFYLSFGPGKSFMGGGFWKPEKEKVDMIRSEIDYNGAELKKIIDNKKFQDFYGGLGEDPDKLKTAPQNYPNNHDYIDLLRHKNFVAIRNLTDAEAASPDFIDLVEEAYLTILPFSNYLKKATAMEEK